jgi:hypothetical protein
MINNKQQQPGHARDHLAKSIADPIITGKHRLAAILNNQVNRYSKQRQKWFLVMFCGVSACGLIISLIIPFGTMAMQHQNFQPTHIGLPSDLPVKTNPLKLTDSLTPKK